MFEIFKDTRFVDAQLKLKVLKANPPKINHILHLLLSVFTGGIWLIVWILIGFLNTNETAYQKQILNLENYIEQLKEEKQIKGKK